MSFSQSLVFLTAVFLAPCAVSDNSAQSLINSIRIFHYVTCKGRRVTSGVMGNFTVTSRLNCVRECTSQPSCRSCTYCRVGATKTCALSSDHQLSCPALPVLDSQCSVAELMVDVCQNGGQFNKLTMTCDCALGWEGSTCETSLFTIAPTPATATAQFPWQTGTTPNPPRTTNRGCLGLDKLGIGCPLDL